MGRTREASLRDAVVVALVVAGLGVGATLPRGGPSSAPEFVATRLPASPCQGVTGERRDACLQAARALLSR
jgi:hypothetical protein